MSRQHQRRSLQSEPGHAQAEALADRAFNPGAEPPAPDVQPEQGAPGAGHSIAAAPSRPGRGRVVQPKLSLGAPNDPDEQEADRVADQVVGQKIAPRIQRAAAPAATTALAPEIAGRIDRLRGGGRPLDQGTRAIMEQRMGHSFGQVRVHTDATAGELARQIQARAFTVGSDVAFAPGQYRPASPAGRRLLAHELAHVVQQGQAVVRRDPEQDTTAATTSSATVEAPAGETQSGKGGPDGKKKEAAPAGDEQIARGSRGDSVKKAQASLNLQGATPALAVDGIFGPLTEQATEAFQAANPPLKVDGIIGPKTWAMLNALGSLSKLKAGDLASLAEWEQMKATLGKEKYLEAIQAFSEFIGDQAARDEFLKSVPQDKLTLFTDLIPQQVKADSDKPLEEQLKASANPKRAEQARVELKAKQADKASNGRLTEALVELLVWGVANRRTESDLGAEGIIGIDQAVNAADALIAMELPAYLDLVMKLALSGGVKQDWNQQQVESVLILKAVAARKAKYQADSAKARKEVGNFANDIRGEDTDKLKQLTSTRDTGDGDGLKQRFTMSCGPTSIQIIHGEADPIYAMEISKAGKNSTEYTSNVAKEQQSLMGKNLIPREVKSSWNAFKAKLNGMDVNAPDVAAWQNLFKYIQGKPFDAALKDQGVKLAAAQGYSNERIEEFKKYFPFDEPGLSVPEYQTALNSSNMAQISNGAYPLKQFDKAKKPVTNGDLDTLWKTLFRGRDVPVGVFWSSGGGHYMTFTDCKGEPPAGGPGRTFLLSDPGGGTSEWISNDDVKNGKFGSFGSGYIDDIYY